MLIISEIVKSSVARRGASWDSENYKMISRVLEVEQAEIRLRVCRKPTSCEMLMKKVLITS
jgi:hypothetical protein